MTFDNGIIQTVFVVFLVVDILLLLHPELIVLNMSIFNAQEMQWILVIFPFHMHLVVLLMHTEGYKSWQN